MGKRSIAPWSVQPSQADHGDTLVVVDAQGNILASCMAIECGDVGHDGPVFDDEDIPNLTLMAAAPELLEACKAILDQASQGVVLERDSCTAQLRDAISKAEGRS